MLRQMTRRIQKIKNKIPNQNETKEEDLLKYNYLNHTNMGFESNLVCMYHLLLEFDIVVNCATKIKKNKKKKKASTIIYIVKI